MTFRLLNLKRLTDQLNEEECECPTESFVVTQSPTTAMLRVKKVTQYLNPASTLLAGLMRPSHFEIVSKILFSPIPLVGAVPAGKQFGFDTTAGKSYYSQK
jgi:hypothetical protein